MKQIKLFCTMINSVKENKTKQKLYRRKIDYVYKTPMEIFIEEIM